MRISDWSSDVCSSDLGVRVRAGLVEAGHEHAAAVVAHRLTPPAPHAEVAAAGAEQGARVVARPGQLVLDQCPAVGGEGEDRKSVVEGKSVSVRVDLGGRRIIPKKTNKKQNNPK